MKRRNQHQVKLATLTNSSALEQGPGRRRGWEMLDPMLGKQERELTQPGGTCFGGGPWSGWTPKTWAAPEPSSIKQLSSPSLTYMAVFSLVYFPSVLSLVFASRENMHTRKAGDPATVGGRNRSSHWDSNSPLVRALATDFYVE